MSATESRPTGLTAAFWLLVVGAVMLFFGGVMAATVGFESMRQAVPPTVSDETLRSYSRLYRGAGALFAVAAVGLAVLAVRARERDPRSRRAVMTLGLTIVVLVGLAAVFAGTHILALLSLVPIVVGTLLLSRPNVVEWYAGE
jgi:heme/copper-type cytochrome/quinol oxidase subunit 3